MGRKYDTITVKKYANRRLYDTSKSTYITLNDIAEMVRENLDFIVVDAKTNEDLTHTVLAQIVLDQESQSPKMFPTDFMRKIIGMYDNNMQQFVPNFLTQAMDTLIQNQEQIQEQFSSSMGQMFPNRDQIDELSRRNMEMFENAMQMFNPFAFPETQHDKATPANDKDAKIAKLEQEIAELRKTLAQRD